MNGVRYGCIESHEKVDRTCDKRYTMRMRNCRKRERKWRRDLDYRSSTSQII